MTTDNPPVDIYKVIGQSLSDHAVRRPMVSVGRRFMMPLKRETTTNQTRAIDLFANTQLVTDDGAHADGDNWAERWRELKDRESISPLTGEELAELGLLQARVDAFDQQALRMTEESVERLAHAHQQAIESLNRLALILREL